MLVFVAGRLALRALFDFGLGVELKAFALIARLDFVLFRMPARVEHLIENAMLRLMLRLRHLETPRHIDDDAGSSDAGLINAAENR